MTSVTTGRPVSALAAFSTLPPERVGGVYDELDLPFGAVRLKFGGGKRHFCLPWILRRW